MDARTRASASSTASFAVATLSRASAEPAAKVADEGGAPLSTLPASDTDTVTVSASSVAPVRRSTNAAAAPSVTGVAAGAIETTGSASVALVALVLAKDAGGLPAASCTGFAPTPVGTV